ncbi:helix-turn-helix domain-containing protein [Klebsiella variicola]|uniref:helix-turn-helix domain-containing protein n=1 Tax=Klebsiella variicola TaxID=244366 RepID=UPI002AB9236D|nr:hypothetical protein [Klebsiella variicola]MDZ0575005.1 helix-turn-helix domain-containing protein [Klebsiella variicola]HBQ3196599.1 helix-turn-helix transcriptional regulator [Klebsiella variicola subsp. variicola]
MTNKKVTDDMDERDFNFGERIALAMEQSQDTISSLVEKTGIPDSTLRGYLNKKSVPTGWTQIRKIIQETGVSASWFFGENQESEDSSEKSVAKDLELLNGLFRYMSPTQRGQILKRILDSLSEQLDPEIKKNP